MRLPYHPCRAETEEKIICLTSGVIFDAVFVFMESRFIFCVHGLCRGVINEISQCKARFTQFVEIFMVVVSRILGCISGRQIVTRRLF